jgi:hypothetical protein
MTPAMTANAIVQALTRMTLGLVLRDLAIAFFLGFVHPPPLQLDAFSSREPVPTSLENAS